jgi:hypothetical protein|tara:strand:- start:21 stop:170 length:150 start_codon:yes stop_codon:yes gene_type:complete
MSKVIVMQRTVDYILTSSPDKIKQVEALGVPKLVEFEDKSSNYFIFKDE